MTKFLPLIIIASICFFLLDSLWFRVAGNFFRSEITSLITLTAEGNWQVRIFPALLAYLCMGVGAVFFVLSQATSVSQAVSYGALFGLVTFGIYDMTNLALLSGWTVRFAVVDVLWGIFANAFIATVLFWVRGQWFS